MACNFAFAILHTELNMQFGMCQCIFTQMCNLTPKKSLKIRIFITLHLAPHRIVGYATSAMSQNKKLHRKATFAIAEVAEVAL